MKKPLNRTLASDFGQSPIPKKLNNDLEALGSTFNERQIPFSDIRPN